MYSIRYLELFNKDLELTLDYISNILCNEMSSKKLKEEVDKKIIEIRKNPYIFSNHVGMQLLKNSYKKAKVNNYYILYSVDEEKKLVKIYRFVYAASDMSIYV